jgi:hypothetical protein
MRTEAYKMRISLLVLVLTPFCLLLLIAFVNNGLQLEMNNSIDINHHVWFSNFIVKYGRIPQDKAYEYMPLSLLMVSILTLINGIYSPTYIILRAYLPQLIFILLLWVHVFNKFCKDHVKVSFILIFLCLLMATYPISYAFYPYYLSINGAIVPIIMLVPLARSILSTSRDRFPSIILYGLLFLVALLSNFSYTLIFVLFFFTSEYLALAFKLESRNRPRNIGELLLISSLITLIYIVYVILIDAISFRNPLIRLLTNIKELLLRGTFELPLKKSSVELGLIDMFISAVKLYGTLLAPYALILLFVLLKVLKEKKTRRHDLAAVLSFIMFIILLFPTGYDAFRITNIVNLLLPVTAFEFVYAFTQTRRSWHSSITVLILVFSIVGLATTVFIQFIPVGFKALDPKVSIYFEEENNTVVEYIPIAEYSVLRPRVHVATLSYLSRYLEGVAFRIVGDRVFCTGFMYVGRRDLYVSCTSLSDMLRIYIENRRVVKYDFKALGGTSGAMIINYPVTFMTEEPVEYRSNILRRAIILETSLIYNSGFTTITIVR